MLGFAFHPRNALNYDLLAMRASYSAHSIQKDDRNLPDRWEFTSPNRKDIVNWARTPTDGADGTVVFARCDTNLKAVSSIPLDEFVGLVNERLVLAYMVE